MDSVNAWTSQWAKQQSIKAHYLPEVESTNSWAKSEFRWNSKFAVFTADHQTHGRGRGGNVWTNSAPGSTWMCTWCFAAKTVPHPLLNMRIGFALYSAINQTWNLPQLSLKAPNDICLGPGKLAGILTEFVSGPQSSLFIGIGMNALDTPDLEMQKTQSLSQNETVDSARWSLFCSSLFRRFQDLLDASSQSTLSAQERDDILLALKNYTLNPVEDLLPEGTLILRDGSRRHWNEL